MRSGPTTLEYVEGPMKIFILALALLLAPLRAQAIDLEHQQMVHDAAHLGVAYLATDLVYHFARRAFRFDRTGALLFSAVAVTSMSLLRQAVVATDYRAPVNMRGFWYGAMGTAASIGTHLVFDIDLP
jgi:hypothetical protein